MEAGVNSHCQLITWNLMKSYTDDNRQSSTSTHTRVCVDVINVHDQRSCMAVVLKLNATSNGQFVDSDRKLTDTFFMWHSPNTYIHN